MCNQALRAILLDMHDLGEANLIPDTVKNVDEDEEESDKQRHPARNDFRFDQKRDPGHDDEHAARKVDLQH